MAFGAVELKTRIRFRIIDNFENYINARDTDDDSEDVIFTGYVYKYKTLQFEVVKRSAYGKGNNYVKEIVEYHGQKVHIPSS